MTFNQRTNRTEPVASPCINVCALNAERTLCTGCYRTLDEISAWSRADEAQRQKIVTISAQRQRQDKSS